MKAAAEDLLLDLVASLTDRLQDTTDACALARDALDRVSREGAANRGFLPPMVLADTRDAAHEARQHVQSQRDALARLADALAGLEQERLRRMYQR